MCMYRTCACTYMHMHMFMLHVHVTCSARECTSQFGAGWNLHGVTGHSAQRARCEIEYRKVAGGGTSLRPRVCFGCFFD